jgi:exosome complex RNA-binding protein Rrp4
MKEIKDQQVFVPGQRIGSIDEGKPGFGVFTRAGSLYATIVGTLDKTTTQVIPLWELLWGFPIV